MGKVTGCCVRAGKVKYQTPKACTGDRKKKPTGCAARRKRQGRKNVATETKVTSNASEKKFGTFDEQTLLEMKLNLPMGRTEREPKAFESHHQEAGKQWARQTKVDRKLKEAMLSPSFDPEASDSCEYSEDEWTSEEYSEESVESNTTTTTEVCPSELTDLAFINFGRHASYDTEELGLLLHENFLDEAEMLELIEGIEKTEWVSDFQNRRVQVYGYNFLAPEKEHLPIPSCFHSIESKLAEHGLGTFTELLVAEYAPGVGIDPHVDRFFWGDKVVGLSLISSCTMNLKDIRTGDEVTSEIKPGSLYCLSGRARYEFSHSIPAESVTGRRISLTFRNLSKSKVIVLHDTESLLELS